MKTLIRFFLFLFTVLFTVNVLGQPLADPGNDPLQPFDSTVQNKPLQLNTPVALNVAILKTHSQNGTIPAESGTPVQPKEKQKQSSLIMKRGDVCLYYDFGRAYTICKLPCEK